MTPKRILVIAAAIVLALRLMPIFLPRFLPSLRASADRLRRRADLGTAFVMLALAVLTFARGEVVLGAVVLLLGVPAFIAGVSVITDAFRSR